MDLDKSNITQLSDAELKDLHRRLSFDVAKYHNYQLAKKVQLNSAYGAMGNQYFRFFDIRLAEAVTISGQVVIQWIARDVNAYLNKTLKTEDVDYVLAMDTDSLYLTLDRLVQTIYKDKNPTPQQIVDFLDKVSEQKIKDVINKSVESLGKYFNVYAQKMRMKRETIAEKAIWTTKKRYILQAWDIEGARYSEPELKIAGLEAVRSSTPEICRKAIKEAIKVIMEKDQEAVFDFVEKFKNEFKSAPLEEIASPTQCNNLDEYADSATIYKKGTPQHVKGALIYNKLLREHKLTKKYEEIRDSDKVRVLMLRQPNVAQAEVISFIDGLPKEFRLHDRIDLDAQFEKVFLKPLNGILEAIGWTSERQSNLDSLLNW